MAREIALKNVDALKNNITHQGKVRLHLLNEDDDCLLTIVKWPDDNGCGHYACVSTGMVFNKETGICLQSTRLSLLLDTVNPIELDGMNSAKFFKNWRIKKVNTDGWLENGALKRGPKTKAQKEYLAMIEAEE